MSTMTTERPTDWTPAGFPPCDAAAIAQLRDRRLAEISADMADHHIDPAEATARLVVLADVLADATTHLQRDDSRWSA